MKMKSAHTEPSEEKKKEKRDGQKLRLKSDSGSLHVVLFTEIPLSYELWKLKTAKMCFQFS